MSEYRDDDKTNTQDFLSKVLDDYAAWYGRVLRASYYPDEADADIAACPPESFEHWYEQVFADIEDNVALEQLRKQHEAVVSAAGAMVEESHLQKPALKTFDTLRENFDEFLSRLRRIDFDRMSGDFGIDAQTGLRSHKVMLSELAGEMERRARRGMPFTLVLVNIDHYEVMKTRASAEDLHDMLSKSAGAISTIMRTVDDAFRLSDHEILVSLKHADMNGGVRFADRVKQYLIDNDVRYQYGDKQVPLTLSFCSGEPLPGDDLQTMVGKLQNDLAEHYKGPGTSIVYEDTAPIERYVKAIQSD